MTPRTLIAGNWKMNLDLAAAGSLARALADAPVPETVDVAICPPFPYLSAVAGVLSGSSVALGAQDCHPQRSGAHTGDVAAPMLADLGCRYAIVGHSERRADHGEDNAIVRAKAQAAHGAGLVAIVCVGETESERDAGDTLSVVEAQVRGSLPDGLGLDALVVAYEPVWAIGTGRTPTVSDVADVHGHLRRVVREIQPDGDGIRLLYGGSVKPGNATELLAVNDVNGALVGGASLVAEDFLAICRATGG